MGRGKRIVFVAIGVYLVALVGAWVWFLPNLVDKRVREHISIGAKAADVEKTFHTGRPFDIESAAHCGSNGPQNVTRIAVYNAGGVPDPPLFALLGIVLYGVAANLMYTGGWALELILRPHMSTRKFAQVAFAAGLCLSVLVTISPAVVIPIACTLGGGSQNAHVE